MTKVQTEDVQKFLWKPRTIDEVAEKFEVSPRTAYRWLVAVDAERVRQPDTWRVRR